MKHYCQLLIFAAFLAARPVSFAASVPADLSGIGAGPVSVVSEDESLTVTWPDRDGGQWRAAFSLDPEKPLITAITLGGKVILQGGRPFLSGGDG